jgi:hypothetical protein
MSEQRERPARDQLLRSYRYLQILIVQILQGGSRSAAGSFAVVSVKVVLQRVADLTLVSQQVLIETSAQELTGDWRGYQQRTAATAPLQEPP